MKDRGGGSVIIYKKKKTLTYLWTCLIGTISDLEDFEGDILLTKLQKAMTTPFHQDVAAAGVWAETQFLWPERTVPYYIPPELGKLHPLIAYACIYICCASNQEFNCYIK